jgi:hypothetical protein
VRCVACGEVQWNLRTLVTGAPRAQECRVCGEELRAERRRPGRRFGSTARERRDTRPGAPK